MRCSFLPLVLGLAIGLGALACAAPGVAISPQPGDFAFLQVDLQG